ncbi:MAG: prephenate dehydratase [Propionicimonas sp.]|uniref:prephenate dehydratase n=1 Tax=Propionicimonas sp. TaxID=1955623 RepID=UPI003D0FCC7C
MLGYFGPAGTFTHQALLTISADEAIAYPSVPQALDAVRCGEVEAAMVPIENSVEGGVSATLDTLASGGRLMIAREVLVPVQFNLYARPGTTLADVQRVITHPHSAAQTRYWTAANLPHVAVTEGGSNAAAAQEVADPASRFDAAICGEMAGEQYGLVPIATAIADNPSAVTRFVLVSRPTEPPEPTGADKTTLVAYMHADHSGALLEILEQFSGRGVSLCRIESRPTKTGMGNYCFSIDAEGHLRDPRVAEAMLGLHRICEDVIFLGSYPRADGVRPEVARGFTDADFVAAREWYATLVHPEDD